MKKFITFFASLLFAGFLVAQAPPPTTPGIGLYIPDHGSLNWDTWYNLNWNLLDGFGVLQAKSKQGAHIQTYNSSSNDVNPFIGFGIGGSSGSYTFTTPYNFTPSCIANPTGPGFSPYYITTTTTTVTITMSSAATQAVVFRIICFGAPN